MSATRRQVIFIAAAIVALLAAVWFLLCRDRLPTVDSLEALAAIARERGLHAIPERADGNLAVSQTLIISERPVKWEEINELTPQNVHLPKWRGFILAFVPRVQGVDEPTGYKNPPWIWDDALLFGDEAIVLRLTGGKLLPKQGE